MPKTKTAFSLSVPCLDQNTQIIFAEFIEPLALFHDSNLLPSSVAIVLKYLKCLECSVPDNMTFLKILATLWPLLHARNSSEPIPCLRFVECSFCDLQHLQEPEFNFVSYFGLHQTYITYFIVFPNKKASCILTIHLTIAWEYFPLFFAKFQVGITNNCTNRVFCECW